MNYDGVIQGGGIVGASLALMLAQQKYRVLLLEKNLPIAPDNDLAARTLALSYASCQIFAALGVWDNLLPAAVPIEQVKVSVQGQYGCARLKSPDQSQPLGYVVGFHALENALYTALSSLASLAEVDVIRPGTMISCDSHPEYWQGTLDNAQTFNTRLLVAADGANSRLGQQQSIVTHETVYGHVALMTNVELKTTRNIAIERFLPQGALALLPWQGDYATLVWTMPEHHKITFETMSDNDFLYQCQQVLGQRIGKLVRCGKRYYFPLTMQLAATQHSCRFLLLGNAAHQLHPIAAQGLNLSLRDIWQLRAQLLHQPWCDIGSQTFLATYVKAREQDQAKAVFSTDKIAKFLSGGPLPYWLRAVGITLFDACAPLKQRFTRLNMGLA